MKKIKSKTFVEQCMHLSFFFVSDYIASVFCPLVFNCSMTFDLLPLEINPMTSPGLSPLSRLEQDSVSTCFPSSAFLFSKGNRTPCPPNHHHPSMRLTIPPSPSDYRINDQSHYCCVPTGPASALLTNMDTFQDHWSHRGIILQISSRVLIMFLSSPERCNP